MGKFKFYGEMVEANQFFRLEWERTKHIPGVKRLSADIFVVVGDDASILEDKDWVVKNKKNQFYRVSPNTFANLYKPVFKEENLLDERG